MALTRSFRIVVERQVASNPAYGKAILLDYIKDTIGFESLGEATDMPPKSLVMNKFSKEHFERPTEAFGRLFPTETRS
jgi:hypothetical protein